MNTTGETEESYREQEGDETGQDQEYLEDGDEYDDEYVDQDGDDFDVGED